jgi:nitrite reductase/ring-hydroxylating ferredoxin subunit
MFRQANRQPLWREEFSIFKADERYVNRRQLTKFLVLTSLGMFVGNLWILVRSWLYKAPTYPVRTVARAGEIPVGGVKLFQYPTPQDQCILVRLAADRYVAYSQKCTHLSCAVYYSREHNRLECPCHEGYFSIRDGSVLQGPPTRPLPAVELERRGDDLVAIRMISEEAAAERQASAGCMIEARRRYRG